MQIKYVPPVSNILWVLDRVAKLHDTYHGEHISGTACVNLHRTSMSVKGLLYRFDSIPRPFDIVFPLNDGKVEYRWHVKLNTTYDIPPKDRKVIKNSIESELEHYLMLGPVDLENYMETRDHAAPTA